jgi:N-methylhydantoinase A
LTLPAKTRATLMARKAVDLDQFALLPFGGAGPTHGFLLAREVGIRRVIVPPSPGVLCAIGSLVADVRPDFVRTIHQPLRRVTDRSVMRTIREAYGALTQEGQAWLAGQGLVFEGTSTIWSADVRYLGQSFELTPTVTETVVSDESGDALRALFHASYRDVYGYADEAADLEVLNVRLTAIGLTRKPAPRLRGSRVMWSNSLTKTARNLRRLMTPSVLRLRSWRRKRLPWWGRCRPAG